MIVRHIVCDRCKQECKGSSYYTIAIGAYDINPTNDGRVSMETLSNNVMLRTDNMFGNRKHYCSDCINRVRMFMEGKSCLF